MAHVIADRVMETTTTTGTGAFTLAGAVTGFQAFSAVCANADTVFYTAELQDGAEWEVGLGTWATGGTLARTSVLASSNGGEAVDFSAGTKNVFVSQPASMFGAFTGDVTKPNNSNVTTLTASAVLSKLLTVDGSGSGVDADLLDGQDSTAFAAAAHAHSTATTSTAGYMSSADKTTLNNLRGLIEAQRIGAITL